MKTSFSSTTHWMREPNETPEERTRDLSELAFAPELLQCVLKQLQPPLGELSLDQQPTSTPDFRESTQGGESSGGGAGGNTASASSGAAGVSLQDSPEVPDQLSTEVYAPGLGNVRVHVRRGISGLSIVMGVADQSVKRMIEQAQHALRQTLESGGLRVASVEIRHHGATGTTLAQDRVKARAWGTRNKKDAYELEQGDPGEAGEQLNLKV